MKLSRIAMRAFTLITFSFVLTSCLNQCPAQREPAAKPEWTSRWGKLITADSPELWWSFDRENRIDIRGADGTAELESRIEGQVESDKAGPVRSTSPLFHSTNRGIEFFGKPGAIKVKDPGENSLLDFKKGDGLTIEAWVKPRTIGGGHYMYVVGKGRTNNKGVAGGNQSYALRLQGKGNSAVLSFLFRNGEDKNPSGSNFHRWTSNAGFDVDERWHHVAITYEFGKQDSFRGYVDGQQVDGVWDLKGATSKGPLVDNDELWIGSSMGMQSGSTFNGFMDEIIIYRRVLTEARILARVPFVPRADPPPMPEAAPPRDKVLVQTIEGISDKVGWPSELPQPSESWTEPAFAFFDMPNRYSRRGIKVDRANPLFLRAESMMTLPAGKYRFLLRTLRYGRMYVDGKLVVATPVRGHRPNAHGGMYELVSKLSNDTRVLYPGTEERAVDLELDGREHEFRLDIHVGGQGRRHELGETSLSFARLSNAPDSQTADTDKKPAQAENDVAEMFHVLSPRLQIALTDAGWQSYENRRRAEYVAINQHRRKKAGQKESQFWAKRHAAARKIIAAQEAVDVPKIADSEKIGNDIDRFILSRLQKAGVQPTALIDDWTFLRRVSLDVIGTPPDPDQIREFLADKKPQRRARFIDRLLEHQGWADAWVGYWQDVLAENPNVVNPTLNNTGPFRWWIHESFLDNKPFDRFATELIEMEGSEYFGGPGGFSMASENDVPFAAKAHIVGQAFLALEMQCARCHDAPYHDFRQSDLFSLAAMLKRSPQQVPKSSTVPGGDSNSELIKVTLKPGESAPVAWPFQDEIDGTIVEGFLRSVKDPRAELAARITSPHNDRFAKVIVNRLWHRYFGRGIIDPVDDWEHAEPSHPALLKWLARELTMNGYDLKHVTRLILNSHAYQRSLSHPDDAADAELFGGASHRRMSAEQLVDSLFTVSGKHFRAGDMNIDVDGSRSLKSSLNLGIPRRAWMFSSLSNERDRPSLSLPYAQPFVTTLQTFGWRASRQNPLTVRDQEATVLQPAIVANGTLGRRFTRLSDDSAFTELAMVDRSVSEIVDAVYQRVLTRSPSREERDIFVELLDDGFANRINPEELKRPSRTSTSLRTGVGWSNHLHPDANRLQIATQETVRQGDAPTKKLKADWRERFEDMLWSLLNSPEYLFIP